MEEIPPHYLCGTGSTYIANSRSIYDNYTYGGETDFEGQYIDGPIAYTMNLGQYECETLDGSQTTVCELNTQSPACGRRTTWNDAWPPS